MAASNVNMEPYLLRKVAEPPFNMNKASKSQVSDTVASAVAASRGTPARMDPYFKQKVKGPPFKPCEEMKYEGVRLTTFKDWPRWGSVWPTLLARAGFFYTKSADQVACFCCGGRLKTWEAGDSPMTEHKRFFPRCRFVTGQDFTNIPLGEAPMVPSGGHGGCTSAKTDYYSRLAKQAAAGRSQANGPSSLNHLTQATMRPHKSLSMTTGGTTGMHSLTVTQIREMTLESKRLESFNNWPTADNLAQASCYYTGRVASISFSPRQFSLPSPSLLFCLLSIFFTTALFSTSKLLWGRIGTKPHVWNETLKRRKLLMLTVHIWFHHYLVKTVEPTQMFGSIYHISITCKQHLDCCFGQTYFEVC